MTRVLYAKSKKAGREQLTLLKHLLDTEQAVELLFAVGTRWREAWVRFFKIPEEEQALFWTSLRVAALFHDLGKANHDFQLAVTKTGSHAQAVRHEHLSALLLALPSFRNWLSPALDVDVTLGAVLSHHIKAARQPSHVYGWCRGASAQVELYFGDADVASILARVQRELGLGPAPPIPQGPWHGFRGVWAEALDDALRHCDDFRRALKKDPGRRLRLAAMKAGVIAADSVASAIVREGHDMEEWVRENVHQPAITAAEIEAAILRPRRLQLEGAHGTKFRLHEFQRLLGAEGNRSLLLAPCGAGKTLAAWQWARSRAEHNQFGRVIFLYPTRGTATEGFRDYVGWAPEGDARLLHGSSAFELASMAENPPESLEGKSVAVSETEARMFALGLWKTRFFSATVDQFLSFLQNRYQSLCLVPALADSLVILDEVHSFDPRMFELLITFLKEFDVPVLCMTATLPNKRRERLRDAGLVEFPRPEHQEFLPDLQESAACARYAVRLEPSAEAAIDFAISAFRKGKRVLIVVNRVARCIEVANAVESALGRAPFVYHSRFRLTDRQDRHRDVVDAFKSDQPAIAVTTQVCEMSLDLDAEVLVTELAPVTSLIQRFGRVNRRQKLPTSVADVVAYVPSRSAPYEPSDLSRAREFLESLPRPTSQAELARRLEAAKVNDEKTLLVEGDFLGSGYFALPGSFREEDDFSVQCVCNGDLEEVVALASAKKPIDGYLLPAPKNFVLDVPKPHGVPPYIGIIDSALYSSTYGLRV